MWDSRLAPAYYISPVSQTLIPFIYEDVGRNFEKKGSAFDFPDANGTYVQDLGKTGMRYPLRVIFSGDNCDIEASAFEEAVGEKGIGTLSHPAYGEVKVIPVGMVSRSDSLKTAANQVVIDITFFETNELIYPTYQDDPTVSALSAIAEYNRVKAIEFAREAFLANKVDQVSFKGKFDSLTKKCKSVLNKVAEAQENVEKQFNAINDSINNSIDALIGDPLTLAFQTSLLIQAPARALYDIKAKLVAYGDLANSIISGDGAVVEPRYGNAPTNTFQANDLYASGYITGMVSSVLNHEFDTKSEAIGAAETLLLFLSDLNVWREKNYEALGSIDTGGSFQHLLDAVGYAAGYLVQISFTLKQEKSVTLDRNRTIIDLCAELYGNIDESLDFFIQSNKLSGDEILEIKQGREIVYYV